MGFPIVAQILIIKLSLATNLLLEIPSSDKYCSVLSKYLFDLVTSEIRTQPIGDSLSNHLGFVIGRGDAPLLISAISPNLLSSHFEKILCSLFLKPTLPVKILLQSVFPKEITSLIKGLREKLFKQQLRFKDNNGNSFPDWEEKVLGDLVEFRNGKAHENDIDENGKYIVVNSKFISQNGIVKKFSHKCIVPLYKDEIVMVMSDVPNGKALARCFLIDENDKYTLNQRICALKGINNHNPFLYYLINRNEYYLTFDSGVGQTNLKKEEVLNCFLLVPSNISEQINIADFLSSIDLKIGIEKKILKEYQSQKKYLLKNLFI